MNTIALSKVALASRSDREPSLTVTLEQLRRFEEAETALQQACALRGIEKPKLVAKR